tara:strand:- start:165 stop:530 length:366 start_codon:yes stop_codon:yes gene_type:complete
MKYDKTEVFERSTQLIIEKELLFIEDIIPFLPCSRSTFYDLFPDKSDELDTIKDLLSENKINMKVSMRSKWYQSDNPTLQVALMKIISTDEEAHRLNGTKQEIRTEGDMNLNIKIIKNDNE